jgi:hypothetical protein
VAPESLVTRQNAYGSPLWVVFTAKLRIFGTRTIHAIEAPATRAGFKRTPNLQRLFEFKVQLSRIYVYTKRRKRDAEAISQSVATRMRAKRVVFALQNGFDRADVQSIRTKIRTRLGTMSKKC